MYLKEGYGTHQDSMGNKGTLNPGEVQWMTAASGIIHDEGKDHPGGMLHGFQMWINLPAKHKMGPPQYQQLSAKSFPIAKPVKGVQYKLIAGSIEEISSPVKPLVPIFYADVTVEPNSEYTQTLPEGFNTCIIYVYDGEIFIGEKRGIRKSSYLLSEKGNSFKFETKNKSAGFLVLAGKKIGQPIVRRGP